MRAGRVLCAVLVCGTFLACGADPSSLEFLDASPTNPRLGDITTVRFKAVDSRGVPMAGATVSFRLQSAVPGVTLSPTIATTNKGDGIASAQVVATGRVSSVVLVAESGDKTALSPPITFAGAGSSARQLTFQCGDAAAPATRAVGAYDESRSLVAGIDLNCTAHVGDRNGDAIVGAQVSFLTEAGTITPTGSTVTDNVGNATVMYKTSLPLPKQTEPGVFSWTPTLSALHTGDYFVPLWMHPWEWRDNPETASGDLFNEPRRQDPIDTRKINNPRDNLVAMIAVTSGEEAYDDVDNNGEYTQGEPWTDLTEPFVDFNDNGTWDPDELWVDQNGNKRWDGKDGKHNQSTLIWVQERILWTGIPNIADVETATRKVFARLRPVTEPEILHCQSVDVLVYLADPWYNSLAQNGDGDGCRLVGSDLVKASPEVFSGPGRSYTYPPGRKISFRVADAHDCMAKPPADAWPGPLRFNALGQCSYSGSPISPFANTIQFDALTGTVR